MFIITKYLITAAVIVLVSEIAKRSDKVGALISSLPLITIMVLLWLYFENQSLGKISNHAYYTFWYVIPTLPMLLAFPYINQNYGFWAALITYILATIVLFALWTIIVKPFGVDL